MDRAPHDIRVPSAILGADLTDLQKLTYIAIRSRQGANPWSFAGQRVLAEDICKDQAQISKAIRALVAEGWVERNGRKLRCLLGPGGARNTSDLDMRIMTQSHKKYDAESSNGPTRNMTQSHISDDSQTSIYDSQSCNYDAESSPSESQQIKPTGKPKLKPTGKGNDFPNRRRGSGANRRIAQEMTYAEMDTHAKRNRLTTGDSKYYEFMRRADDGKPRWRFTG